MQGNRKSATAALKALIAQEVQKSLRVLGLRDMKALRREAKRYPAIDEGGHWCDGGYATLAPELIARIERIELTDALDHDGVDQPLEIIDDRIARLHELLPLVSKRPPTAAELQPVLDRAKRFETEVALSLAAAQRLAELRERVQAAAA